VTEETGLSADDHHLWHVYRDLYVVLSSVLRDQLLSDSGLSTSEFGVLNNLPADPDLGSRIRDICAVLGWEWSRVSHLVVRMEKRGLVTRHHCDSDGRGTEVRITDAGRAALDGAAPKHWDAVRRYFFEGLSPTDRRQLTQLLERMLRRLTENVDG
jgi:DNA-binding MarR family transcriptional regulator